MDSKASLNRLLAVLAEREIGLGYDDLAWLFESPQSREAMISWVHEYLGPATLLSPEELELHALLSQSRKKSHTGITDRDNGSPRPLEETDLDAAINSLESSTAAIEMQCAILETQRDALRQLQAHNRQPVSVPDSDSKSQSQARNKAQLNLETSELTDSINQRLTSVKRNVDGNLGSLRSSSERQLDKDDRLLDGLQRVMFKLAPLESSAAKLPDFHTLARALVKLQGKIVKDRTNAIYLSALERANGISDGETDGHVTFELTEELESLITEVDSVLEMVINKHHLEPILKNLQNSDIQSRHEQQQWLSYIKETLSEMAQRMDILASCTKDNTSYSSALTHVNNALAKTLPPQTQPPSKLARNPSTTRSSSPKKTFKPLSHNSLSKGSKDPTLELLSHHNIRLPESTSPNHLTSTLQTSIQERQSRLRDLQNSTGQAMTAQIAESSNMADGQLQNLLGALYAYSPYGSINLADEKMKEGLERLDAQIAAVGDGVRRLDVDALAEVEKKRLMHALSD